MNAERAYIGALLLLPAAPAAAAAALVGPPDLEDPRMRVVMQLVRDVTARGVAPDPVVCLSHARASGAVTTAHAITALAGLLHELYAECPLPASVAYYAVAVLDESLRRRCVELGERIRQAGESASLAELVRVVGAEVHAVVQLRNRRAATLTGLGMAVEELAA